MKAKKYYILEAVAILLFLIYMLPFALVLINSSKPSLQIIMNPLALPESFSQLFTNIKTVMESPNVRYGSSFVSSLFITVFSVALLVLFSSMAAWVLVRTKSVVSNVIFMVFVAAMVIPFQVVMFPLVSWLDRKSVV